MLTIEVALRRRVRSAWVIAATFMALIAGALPLLTRPALAVEEAEAAQGPPFNIAVFLSSRDDACYETGNVAAIKRLALDEQKKINRRGGILGRPVQINFFDDFRDEKKSIANVSAALSDPRMLAMVGLSGSNRPKAVFETLGDDIKKSGIPFLSDISLASVFKDQPNVFTTRASQDDDRVPVMATFTRKIGYQRPGFIGIKDMAGSDAMAEGLKAKFTDNGGLLTDSRVALVDNKLVEDDIAKAVAETKEKSPDIVFLTMGGTNAAAVISQLKSAGMTPALFVGGLGNLPADAAKDYPNAIYSIAWDHPPEVYNNRIRTLISPQNAARWIFEGAKIEAAPGWAKGECEERPVVEFPDPFTEANMRAIVAGSQFADMIALVTAAARTGEKTTDILRLRGRITEQLATTYATGRGVFKGTFDNWSFVPASRTAARNPFIVIMPQGLGRTQLAPIQFIRAKDGSLRQVDTLYTDVDMIQAHRVDENEKTFQAEFYLSMRANPSATIDRIEFANAYQDTENGGRQLSVEPLHDGGASTAYPDTMKIYKVSGRFLFDPELANYPFDTQRFTIQVQPKDGEKPFIVQPPPLDLRDRGVTTDGWDPKAQYVGYEEDFVPVVDAYTHAPSVVPFYKTSFGWEMQRQTTDYLLRVAVPLAFILFVAYLSIFIPRTHFEAIVTIQVTALLSAVALYLSLPKLDSDTATLSDRAFVFAYMILSIMICISILRINPWFSERKAADRLLEMIHVAAIPIFVVVAAYYGYQLGVAAL